MKTTERSLPLRLRQPGFWTLALLVLVLGSPRALGQATTSGLTGRVLSESGMPLSDARVTVRHEPTATTYEVPVRANGSFSLRGLRPGGPYSIEAAAEGYVTGVQRGLFLELDRAAEVSLTLQAAEVIELEELVVSGNPFDSFFQSDRMGGGSQLGAEDVASIPVGDRSLNSLLRLDPRIIYNRDPSDRAFSAGGASNRYNSILIDGVGASDPFGLSANNTAAERNVIPLDSVEAVAIATSPVDTRFGGFTGARVNAVTKSGTNEFSGSLYFLYRDDRMVRKNLELIDGRLVRVPEFEEKTMGLTLGGPIVRDTLWFFIAYEQVDEDKNPPTITNFPTAEALNRIITQAKALGADPGNAFETVALKLTDENLLVKLDWNINPVHRATFRYNTVSSERPTFQDYGGRNLTFDSYWYSQDIENTSYIGQLFSRWSPEFSTEVSLSYSEYRSAPTFATRAPMVRINNVPVEGTNQTGTVWFGTERSRHFNRLEVDTWTFEAVGTYELNLKNTLMFGYQLDRKEVFNAFVQDWFGNYEFNSIEDFEKAASGGWSGRYQYKFATPGVNPAAEFREAGHGLFAQNTYHASNRLTLTGGLRLDIPHFGERPPYNAAFEQAFGFPNNATYSGQSLLQPRAGFNLKLDDENVRQLRGSAGLYYGSMPRVWMSNSYSNTGFNFNTVDVRNADTPPFSPDPDNQPIPQVSGAVAQQVVALDPDFELPSSWKATLGYDHRAWEHVFSVDAEFSWVHRDVLFVNINRVVDTVAPDGREILGGRVSNAFVNDTILLTNTRKGDARHLIFSVERPKTEDGWYYRFSYTNGKVNEVQYGTSSVARSNWANRSILNQGEDVVSRGELEIKHRFLGVLRKEFRWSRDFITNVSLVYDGRSGLPYSFRYINDVNNDGVSTNDLIYVPRRDGDPAVVFASAADRDLFFQMVDKYRLKEGEVVSSGHARYPFVHQFDLSISQEIKLPGWRHSLEIGLDILNVGNLLNSSWGIIRGSNSYFQKTESAVRATYNKTTGQYTYSAVNADLAAGRFNPHTTRGEPNSSRYAALLSVRYKF